MGEDRITYSKALDYVVFQILYVNDTVCHYIKFSKKYIDGQDKETIKIYGALKKRANEYLRSISKTIQKDLEFFSTFCGEMDSKYDPIVENLYQAVNNAFIKHQVPNSELYAHIEVIRCLSEFSVNLIDIYIDILKTEVPQICRMEHYKLKDIHRVAVNLASWVQHFNKINQSIDLMEDDKSVAEAVQSLYEMVSFDDTYKSAILTATKKEGNNEV